MNYNKNIDNNVVLDNNVNNINIDLNMTNESINLTKEQEIVYMKLIEYMKDDKTKEILLIGYAGTGKTTMVTKFINDLIKYKLCKKIVMAAPTHKAVNIAKSKLFTNTSNSDELNKYVNIMTIHRLLSYQSYLNYDGEKIFAKGKIEPKWSIYDLIVVDECSMLSNQIITDIKTQLSNQNNSNVKIIYVGDPAQLPPVNQSESKIFNGTLETLVLDKIIRTSNQKIMDLSNSHRKWIFSKKIDDIPHIGEYESESIKIFSISENETKKWLNKFIDILKSNNNKKIISNSNKLDKLAKLDNLNNLLSLNSNSNSNSNNDNLILTLDCKKMIENHNNNIILTWTNKKSNVYNQYVREKIFGRKNLAQYEIGEILIFNDFHKTEIVKKQNVLDMNLNLDLDINDNNNNNNNDKSTKINTVSFYTSEQVKLININQSNYNFTELKFKINNNITLELNDKFRKCYKQINKLLQTEMNIYNMQVQKIKDLMDNAENIKNMENIDFIQTYDIMCLHPNSDKKYNYINEQIDILISNLKSSCYEIIYKSKEKENMIICNLQSEIEKKINKLYKEYQSNVIDCFAQLNYGYCITVHKSQGSTFKNVFVDMSDILDNNNQNETSKCLYTAITRSSKKLYLLV